MVEKYDNEKARDVFALFNTPLGQKVLGHLDELTVEKSIMPAVQQDGHMAAILMALREGENQMVRKIKAMIKTGGRLEDERRTNG